MDNENVNQDLVAQFEDDAISSLLIALIWYISVNGAMIWIIWWLLKPLFK